MGTVGAALNLVREAFTWWKGEAGYKQWTLDREIKYWNKELKNAMRKRPPDLVHIDNAFSELRRLRRELG